MMNVNKQQLALLTCRLGTQYYAIPVLSVLEVTAMMSLSKVTNASEAMLGIANRHGTALPMLDLRIAFTIQATPPDVSTLFIVAHHNETQVGLVVDEIFQVKYVDPAKRKDAQGAGRYISHTVSDGQQLYQQINLDTLLQDYLAQYQ